MIEVVDRTRSGIDVVEAVKIAEEFLSWRKKKKADLSIAFVGDKAIRELNKTYRKKDKVTDVLSFEDSEELPDGRIFIGELVIDFQQIKRQARKLRKDIREELYFILVHGILHLLGYEDETTAGYKEMISLGEEFINQAKGKYF